MIQKKGLTWSSVGITLVAMSKQQPIIFLDFDGVLNNQLFYTSGRSKKKVYDIDPENVNTLKTLFKFGENNPKIVISSSWRTGRTIEDFDRIFSTYDFHPEVIGMTDHLGKGTVRGNEIKYWLDEHPEQLGVSYYDYNKYVIFDDDSDMLLCQRNNFIHVDGYCGLSPRNVYHAERILGLKQNDVNAQLE